MSNFNAFDHINFLSPEADILLTSENLTLVTFIQNEIEENIFLQSKIVKNFQNELILISNSFTPKNLKSNFVITKSKTFEEALNDIFAYINTDWFIYLKPGESFNENIVSISQKANSYYLNIITIVNEKVRQADLLSAEKRLFHKNFKALNSEADLNTKIINYRKLIPDLEKFEMELNQNKYRGGDRSLKAILFLEDKGLIKLSTEQLLGFLKNENSNTNQPEQVLALYLFISRRFIAKKEFENAKDLLIKAHEKFNNSPDINALLAEIFFIEKNFLEAEKYILSCLQLGKNNSFYKFLPFSFAIIDYASYYFLGKIYYAQKEFVKSITAFENCLIAQPNFKQAKIDLEEVKQKLNQNNGTINELDFVCQGCGNCCRMFEGVPISHIDVIRILDNRPYLNVEDFADFTTAKVEVGKKTTKQFFLKKRKNNSDCIFLAKDSRCEINSFKPLACKTWPFTFNSNKDISWGNRNRNFIKKYCSHKMEKGANNELELMENLLKIEQYGLEFAEIIKKIELKSSDTDYQESKDTNLFINLIKEMIQSDPN